MSDKCICEFVIFSVGKVSCMSAYLGMYVLCEQDFRVKWTDFVDTC